MYRRIKLDPTISKPEPLPKESALGHGIYPTHFRKFNQRTSITTENQPDTVNNKARDEVRTTHEQKDHFKYKTCHPK